MRKFKYRMSVATLGAMAIFATAQANAAMFTLDNGNAALSGNAPPYGTVSITRIDNNDAKVTLTAFGLYSFGDGETLGLNLAGGGSFTMSSLSGTTLGTGPGNTPGAATIGSYSLEGLGNVDGWGNYNFRLKTFDGFKFSVTSLTFNIHTTSGAWTSEAAILGLNSNGFDVAGHVFTRLANGTDTGITGFATTTPVPEPTTMIAGALLLLPFGASTMRVLRKKRVV